MHSILKTLVVASTNTQSVEDNNIALQNCSVLTSTKDSGVDVLLHSNLALVFTQRHSNVAHDLVLVVVVECIAI